jgi:hypothetical protein
MIYFSKKFKNYFSKFKKLENLGLKLRQTRPSMGRDTAGPPTATGGQESGCRRES